jgi:hypothetical protein
MKSWLSKASSGLALAAACGALNSCALNGGGKYAEQTEIETDVPDSLENGKPSRGPAAQTNTYAASTGVPATSNLIDNPDPVAPLSAPPPLPAKGAAGPPGGASVVGLTPENGRELIDIPKPDFNDISVHSSRPPAEMLSLGPALKPAKLGNASAPPAPKPASTPASAPVRPAPEKSAPPTPPSSPPQSSETEIAQVPKALKSTPSSPSESEPGVPLLHSGGSLSSFYANIHKEVLEPGGTENKGPGAVTTPPPDDATSVPPPPPAADYAAPPALPPKK